VLAQRRLEERMQDQLHAELKQKEAMLKMEAELKVEHREMELAEWKWKIDMQRLRWESDWQAAQYQGEVGRLGPALPAFESAASPLQESCSADAAERAAVTVPPVGTLPHLPIASAGSNNSSRRGSLGSKGNPNSPGKAAKNAKRAPSGSPSSQDQDLWVHRVAEQLSAQASAGLREKFMSSAQQGSQELRTDTDSEGSEGSGARSPARAAQQRQDSEKTPPQQQKRSQQQRRQQLQQGLQPEQSPGGGLFRFVMGESALDGASTAAPTFAPFGFSTAGPRRASDPGTGAAAPIGGPLNARFAEAPYEWIPHSLQGKSALHKSGLTTSSSAPSLAGSRDVDSMAGATFQRHSPQLLQASGPRVAATWFVDGSAGRRGGCPPNLPPSGSPGLLHARAQGMRRAKHETAMFSVPPLPTSGHAASKAESKK